MTELPLGLADGHLATSRRLDGADAITDMTENQFLMWTPQRLQPDSTLYNAGFAYTIYGVAITPALLAALTWKRATKAGGLASIILGTLTCLGLKFFSAFGPEHLNPEGDPLGIPLIYPSFIVSVLALVIVSYLTPPPTQEVLDQVFKPEEQATA